MKKIISVLCIIAFAVSGCATMARYDNWFNTNEDSLKTAVQLATAVELRGKPDVAAKVTASIQKVQAAIASGQLITAEQVQAFVADEVSKLNIDPVELAILNPFIGKIQDEIVHTFTVLNLRSPAQQLVEINKVLGWVTDISKTIK